MVPCTLLTDNFYEIREIPYSLPVKHRVKKIFQNFLLHQKLRLEISWGPSGGKWRIRPLLGVQN